MADDKEMTPIERAARAVVSEMKAGSGYDEKFVAECVARAVLQAIREPSEEMVEAGCNARFPVYRDGKDHGTIPRWQAMIDAALGEG